MRASILEFASKLSYVRRRGKDGTLFKSYLLAFGRKNERASYTEIAANSSRAPHISSLKNVRRHTYSHLTFWVVLLHISNFACPPVTASGVNGGGDGGRPEQSRVGRRIRIDPEVSYHRSFSISLSSLSLSLAHALLSLGSITDSGPCASSQTVNLHDLPLCQADTRKTKKHKVKLHAAYWFRQFTLEPPEFSRPLIQGSQLTLSLASFNHSFERSVVGRWRPRHEMGRFASSVQSRRDGVDGLVLDRKQGGEIFWQLKGEAGDLKDLEVQAAGAEEVIVLPTNKHCKPSSTTPTTYSSFYCFNLP